MDGRRTLVEGMIAGGAAYIVVAGFFGVAGVLTGGSFFQTAYLIGQALGANPPPGSAEAGTILAANGLHVVISMAAGIVAAWLMDELEHHHTLWYAVLLAFLGGYFLSTVAMGILAAEISGVTTWLQATIANTLAALVIGGYLGWAHRGLIHELSEEFGH